MSAGAVLRLVEDMDHVVGSLRHAALADSTIEHYQRVWNHYCVWCADREIDPLAAGGAPLAVWLSEHFDLRPGTVRTYVNAVSWGCRRASVDDPALEPVVSRFLNAHSRFHGVAPVAENTVSSFDRDELVAVVSAPFVSRGGVSETALLRNRCAFILAYHGVSKNQLVRVRAEGVWLAGETVHVDLPAVTCRGLPHSDRAAAHRLTVPVRDDDLDPRQLVALAGSGPERELLFGVTSVVRGGRHGSDVVERATDSTHDIFSVLVSALRSSVRRAHLDPSGFADIATFSVDDLRRLLCHANPGHLTELRTRAYAAALASTGARHDDFAHVRVETMKRQPAGLRVLVDKSKTDRAGVGEWKMISHTPGHPPTCPACLVARWITEARLTAGPLFAALGHGGKVKDTPVAVEEMAEEIQRLAQRVGVTKRVGTHSFRKTHATLRAEAGDEAWAIAKTTGQTADVILRHYVTPVRVIDHTAQM